MENEDIENPGNLCRICFDVGQYHITSYQLQIHEENYELKEILSELSALETWKMENTPSMICNTCIEQLGKCYMFIKKLRNADEKIKQMIDTSNIVEDDVESSTSDMAEYELFECLDTEQEIEDIDEIPEEEAALPEVISDTSQDTERKGIKRKVNNKHAHFVLTKKVTNILSNAQKLIHHERDEFAVNQQPPIKISKDSHEGNCFLITKFIPSQSTMIPEGTEAARDDLLVDPNAINNIRMFDMAAVEVNASGKIELNEDDDTNIENPNTMYMCQYCPRAFATSHHLIMHQRKSHVCQFCMKGFSKVSDLHKHSKEEHNQFNCAICKKDFSSNSNLRQHMKRIHTVELPAHVSLLSFRKKEASS